MSWVYLDDHFPDHPKVVAAGGDAAWLFVCGLAYVKRYETEGVIPKAQVARLTDRRASQKLALRLCDVGLWEDHGDAYSIHDYHEWNKPAEKRKAAARKAAQARWSNANADANASESHSERIESAHAERCPTPRPPSPSPHNPPVADLFGVFYDELYPRREAKGKAEKAWAKAVERAAPEEIIEGLRRQLAVHPLMGASTKQYVPLPASWLNADRWLDEVQAPAAATPPRKVIGIVDWNGVQMQGLVDAS